MSTFGTLVPGPGGEPRQFPCEQCGAELTFSIGQQTLTCEHCGFKKELMQRADAAVREQDLNAALARQSQQKAHTSVGSREYACASCAATLVFEGSLTSSECPYCGAPVVDANVHTARDRIGVDGVVPFLVKREAAQVNLRQWVKSRWFAPNAWKRRGVEGRFNGVYLPYWTFDAMTASGYVGERGEHYYVTVGSGKNQRREQRTRWYPAAGHLQRFFDDVLVCAARAVPERLMRELEPWPLRELRPWAPELLSGYSAMTYDEELAAGFSTAKERIAEAIRVDVCRDIGGDTQRIHSIDTAYDALKYKHLLLPVWMLAYVYGGKSRQVVVNATTGEVQGERPYSWLKITFAALVGLALAALAANLWASQQ